MRRRQRREEKKEKEEARGEGKIAFGEQKDTSSIAFEYGEMGSSVNEQQLFCGTVAAREKERQ